MTKEQIQKDQERGKNMAKMMTQRHILSKNVMGTGFKSANDVGVGEENPKEAHFEALYKKKVNFLENQGGGFHPNYPRPGGNQSWNRERDDV
ncbi:hypothetical protein MTR67_034519 [Solanum verrucosum]|uniref:Uncharacterized protein n=1 Tax=Solanum verrucosum TaxID=315347 RepID=A0AAF0ZLD5_SOLVR|nr:hypothetical protein MTR67_034519 [Solanum verrucosum]